MKILYKLKNTTGSQIIINTVAIPGLGGTAVIHNNALLYDESVRGTIVNYLESGEFTGYDIDDNLMLLAESLQCLACESAYFENTPSSIATNNGSGGSIVLNTGSDFSNLKFQKDSKNGIEIKYDGSTNTFEINNYSDSYYGENLFSISAGKLASFAGDIVQSGSLIQSQANINYSFMCRNGAGATLYVANPSTDIQKWQNESAVATGIVATMKNNGDLELIGTLRANSVRSLSTDTDLNLSGNGVGGGVLVDDSLTVSSTTKFKGAITIEEHSPRINLDSNNDGGINQIVMLENGMSQFSITQLNGNYTNQARQLHTEFTNNSNLFMDVDPDGIIKFAKRREFDYVELTTGSQLNLVVDTEIIRCNTINGNIDIHGIAVGATTTKVTFVKSSGSNLLRFFNASGSATGEQLRTTDANTLTITTHGAVTLYRTDSGVWFTDQ